MNIRKTIITATVALTMVAMIAPTMAGASTISDLQAQIAALTAQLNSLSSTTTTTSSGSMPAACVGVTFSRNLRVGMTGQDVQCFQVLLNTHGYVLASSGAGSPGHETMYFGLRTLAAVRLWQAAQGWTPANQVGPLSRAKFNSWLTGGSTTTTTTTTTTTPTTPTTPAQTGPITVMLSADSPAAGGKILGGQSTADLAHFTFSGTGTVTSVSLKRSGASDQNTLTNVYLFDGNTRITDGYSFNVSGNLVMNGLSIVVNGSHTISVRADVASSQTAYDLIASLVGYTANGTASAVNIMGNDLYYGTANLASATITAAASVAVPTANVNAGTTSYTFWSAPVQINTRAVWLKMANFRMIGSAPSDALANINMFIDGVNSGRVGTVTAINGSNYVVFDLTANPISLATGSHTLDMRADIQKGTNRNVQIGIQQAADLTLTDPSIGVNIAVSSTTAGSFSANNAGTISILTGSVTVVVDPTFTTQTNIPGGAANAVIARFKLHAYGEDVKINTVKVTPEIDSATSTGATCTTNASGVWLTGTCGLNNVTLYFNGSQIGSQQNWTMTSASNSNAPLTFTLGSQMIAPAGQDSFLEVRADMQTAASVAYTGGTVKVTQPIDTTNFGQGMLSQATLAVPSAAVATTGLTVQTGGLSVAKSTAYLNQNISPNASGVRVGSYVIQNQSSSQSVRLTSFSIATTITTTTVSNFSALRTSDTTGAGSTPIQFSGTGSGTTSTDVFSVNDTLAPGASMVLDLFANTGAATSGTIATTLNVSSIGVIDNISATSGAKSGQTLTLGTGTVNATTGVTLVVSSTTPAQFVAAAGGATNAAQATFNIVSTSGASTITELKFVVSGNDATTNSNTVTNVCVPNANGTTTICAAPVNAVADLTGLSLAVPNAGSGLTINALTSYSSVGTNGIAPATTARIALDFIKYTTGSATNTLCSTTQATADGITCTANFVGTNASPESTNMATVGVAAPFVDLVGSVPTVTVPTTIATGLNLGQSNQIGQVIVAANSKGAVKVRTITFSVTGSGFSTTSGQTMSVSTSPFIAIGSTQIVGSSCSTAVVNTTSDTITCQLGSQTYATDYAISAGGQQTFNLYVTVTGTAAANAKAAVASSVTASGFVWDDTSDNGGSTALGLTGSGTSPAIMYGFTTASYQITQ